MLSCFTIFIFFFGNFAWRKDRHAAAMGCCWCCAYEMSNCTSNQFQIMLSRFSIHLSFTWLHEITDNWVDAVGTQMKTFGQFFSSFLLLFSVIFSSKKWSSYKLLQDDISNDINRVPSPQLSLIFCIHANFKKKSVTYIILTFVWNSGSNLIQPNNYQFEMHVVREII